MLARRGNIENPHGDTCQWILETDDYQAWTDQSNGLLWIKGKPGAGKSVLMAFLYNKLKQQRYAQNEVQLDFFFSARGAELQHKPLGMIRALLNQLFVQDSSIRPRIREAYAEKRKAFGRGHADWQWQRRELESLFLDSVLRSARHHQVYVFVDALDEAGEQSAREIATYFHQINDRVAACSATLKICISSRHYPVPTNTPGVEIYVERYNGDDILKYIRDHFMFDKGQSLEDREAWLELKADLISRAAGIFQWVCLIIHMIEGYVTEGYSPREIQLSIREVPQALSDVYEYILRNIIRKNNIYLSLLLFQWVCMAERPLSTEEMRYALAANYAMVSPKLIKCDEVNAFIRTDALAKSRINSLSGGLIEVTDGLSDPSEANEGVVPDMEGRSSTNGVVQVIHQSVNDFLVADGLELMAQLVSQASSSSSSLSTTSLEISKGNIAERCHNDIFRSCLNYIAVEVSNTPEILLFVQHPSSSPARLVDQLPLLKYATQSLFIHAKNSASEYLQYPKEVAASLRNVLNDWISCYRCIDHSADKCPQVGTTLLHVAAMYDDTNLIRHLLEEGINVDIRGYRGETALHTAAQHQHAASAEILLEAGADIDARCGFDQTPLMACICRPEPTFAEWLLGKGANANPVDERPSITPLWEAASRGHISIIERLISAGADVNAWTGIGGTALRVASSTGQAEAVETLIRAGANVDMHSLFVATPLTSAVEKDNHVIAELLLQEGADINACGGTYSNALQAASYCGANSLITLLIQNGAEIDLQGGKYGTALQAWAASNYHPSMPHLESIGDKLLAARADVNIKGGEFGSALQAASYVANGRALERLIEAGADVNAVLYGGETALMSAVASGRVKHADLLLKHGANFLATDDGGLTPVHYGARAGFLVTIDLLLEKEGLHVNQQDGLGRTPLHLAFAYGHTDQAWALVESYDADMTICDVFGRSALDYVFHDLHLPHSLRQLLSTRQPARRNIDAAAIRRHMFSISQDLLQTTPRTMIARLYELVHCFSQLSDLSIAWPFVNMLLRLQVHKDSTLLQLAACSLCFREFKMTNDPWHVCRQCPFFDLCSQCTISYPPGNRPPWCCNHEAYEIKKPETSDENPNLYNWFGIFEDDFLNFVLLDSGDLSIADFAK